MRKVKDAKDLESDELIYFKGHAKATYLSDGRNVEEAINQVGDVDLSEYAKKEDLSNLATKSELAKKAEGSIESLDNGNIKVTINGVSEDFMPATPSGDPMHHYYESIGAQWNDGEDKTLQIPIYGKDFNTTEYFPVVHKSKRWYFNLLGDITNAQMAEIVSYPRTICGEGSYSGCLARSIAFEGNGTSSALSYRKFGSASKIESIYAKKAMYPSDTYLMFYGQHSLKYLLGTPGTSRGYIIGYEGLYSNHEGLIGLQEIRIMSTRKNITLLGSANLSKTSILFMVNEASPTTAITITLHATAYARIANDEEVIAALDAKNTALQDKGGSVSIVSA